MLERKMPGIGVRKPHLHRRVRTPARFPPLQRFTFRVEARAPLIKISKIAADEAIRVGSESTGTVALMAMSSPLVYEQQHPTITIKPIQNKVHQVTEAATSGAR